MSTNLNAIVAIAHYGLFVRGGLSGQHEIVYPHEANRANGLYRKRLYERCRKRII